MVPDTTIIEKVKAAQAGEEAAWNFYTIITIPNYMPQPFA
jgi:hypothetical protein